MSIKQLRFCLMCLSWVAVFSTIVSANDIDETTQADPQSPRHFDFSYAGTIDGLEAGSMARVWLPLAKSSVTQQVTTKSITLPADYRMTQEKKYDNSLVYFEATADENGEIPFSIEYSCLRYQRNSLMTDVASPCDRPKYLQAARLIPVDAGLFAGWLPPLPIEKARNSPLARHFYDAVGSHMRYDKPKGEPWGRGDAKWACDSGYGNCTDFHSLFLAACRFHRIPSRFEMGFPIPDDTESGEVGGYHCWAAFEQRGKWIPVDISEADKNPQKREFFFGNLDSNRIRFSVGRDLELVPAPARGPVNFLVYPYVEVDGRTHTQFTKEFVFCNQIK